MKTRSFVLLVGLLSSIAGSCNNGRKQSDFGYIAIDSLTIEPVIRNETVHQVDLNWTLPKLAGSAEMQELTRAIQVQAEADLKNLLENPPFDNRIYESQISYETHYTPNLKLLSLILTDYKFNGGAHGNTLREAYNIDISKCSQLGFNAVFKENATAYFNQQINSQIKINLQSSPEERIYFDDAAANIQDAIWYVQDDNIVFEFPQYAIAPYSSGMPKFLFNLDNAADYLR